MSRTSGRVSMRARFQGVCRVYSERVHVRDSIFFFPVTGAVEHTGCARRRRRTTPVQPQAQPPLPRSTPPEFQRPPARDWRDEMNHPSWLRKADRT